MATLLQEKLAKERKERKAIDEKVQAAPMRPTDEEAEAAKKILTDISKEFRGEIAEKGTSGIADDVKGYVKTHAVQKAADYETQQRVERLVMSNITGLGPIQQYMDDDAVTEIVVERYDKICIERNGAIEEVEDSFMNEEQLQTIIRRIIESVGRSLNLYSPMVDARLPDGSRINATIPPVTPDGATLTIRKFSKAALTGQQYVKLKSLSPEMLAFLKACVQARVSLIVSGGTNSGKTTLLNMLSSYIPERELIVTIEDSLELRLNQKNVRRMETRQVSGEGMIPVTIQSLVKNSLRMRPDRIVIGEVRDGTIVDLMSAMSTGHEGSMSTIHANSPKNLILARMPILYSMNSAASFSETAQQMQIAEALHLIIQIARGRDGKRRITHITHVSGYDKDKGIILRDIFLYRDGKFEATGYVPKQIIDMIHDEGIEIDEKIFVKKDAGGGNSK